MDGQGNSGYGDLRDERQAASSQGCVFMIIDKGNCTKCGLKLIDWDLKYSNGDIILCGTCFKEFSKDNPVIVEHCPGCVDNGNSYDFYIWKGLDQFLKDEPCSPGYEYVFNQSSKTQGHIMEDNGKKWWVIWIVKDERILKELSSKLPRWKYR